MFFHFVFSLYLPHPLEFLRVLSLEKSRATRVTFRDQKHWNRLKDKKVIAKNNPKIKERQTHFVFCSLVHIFRTLGSFCLRLAGLTALTAGNVCCKRERNRMKDKKVISKKTKKNVFFCLFFCFFGLFFPHNFRTLWSFCVFLASKSRWRRAWFFQTKNKEIEWQTKKLEQKTIEKLIF